MNDSRENVWIGNHFPDIRKHFSDKRYTKLLKYAFDMFEWNSNPPFIFCLSANGDLLSQWRAYSQDGHGVAIGFKTNSLKIGRELPGPNVYADRTLGLARVEYQPRVQKKSIARLCREVEKEFTSTSAEEASVHLAFELVDWAMIFKNPTFEEEKEWRIIHTPLPAYEFPSDRLSPLKFRLRPNGISTYYIYSFNEDFNSNLVPEIVVGPKCQMDPREVKQFIGNNGLSKTRVRLSKASYR